MKKTIVSLLMLTLPLALATTLTEMDTEAQSVRFEMEANLGFPLGTKTLNLTFSCTGEPITLHGESTPELLKEFQKAKLVVVGKDTLRINENLKDDLYTMVKCNGQNLFYGFGQSRGFRGKGLAYQGRQLIDGNWNLDFEIPVHGFWEDCDMCTREKIYSSSPLKLNLSTADFKTWTLNTPMSLYNPYFRAEEKTGTAVSAFVLQDGKLYPFYYAGDIHTNAKLQALTIKDGLSVVVTDNFEKPSWWREIKINLNPKEFVFVNRKISKPSWTAVVQ